MRAPSPREQSHGADERSPAKRPADVPEQGGEALVEHLADRLAQVERDLRRARDAAAASERQRAVLGRVARQIAESSVPPLPEIVRTALPALGSWSLVEELTSGDVARQVIAIDPDIERAAAVLNGRATVGPDAPLGLARVLRRGRVERLDALPVLGDDQTTDDRSTRDALARLATGPLLLVPVLVRARIVGALTFGRPHGADPYDAGDQRFAEEVASLVAVAIGQRLTAEAADAAAKAKAEFLTMMSHELRTPLNAIAGYAQLLEMGFRGPLNDAQRDAVTRILRGQEHLLELVDAVLTFSRLTSGRLALAPSATPALALMDAATAAVRSELAARGIEFRRVACSSDVMVSADEGRALEILRHLLVNAAKFTPRGGQVTLACERGAGVVRFVVADTGRGIAPSQREAIFQPFVQVEKGLTRSVDGTGLGLAVGRELAERMGGSLTVTSEEGVGSRFVLTLPRAEADSLPASIDSPPATG
jgi:signal transduction histidine kinase